MMESWNALFLVGAVNSFFLGLLLWGRRKRPVERKANRFLSLILFSWSYGFFYTWIIETGMYRRYPHLLLIGAPFTFLTGPCLYLYTETILGGLENSIIRNRWNRPVLHFLPFILNTLALVPFYVQSGAGKIHYWETRRPGDPWFLLMQCLQLLHLGTYLAVLLLRIRRHRAGLGENYSSFEGLALDWLRNLILFGWIGLLAYVIVLVFFRYWTGFTEYINRFTDLVVLGILHILGYEALSQPAILKEETILQVGKLPPDEPAVEVAEGGSSSLRYPVAFNQPEISAGRFSPQKRPLSQNRNPGEAADEEFFYSGHPVTVSKPPVPKTDSSYARSPLTQAEVRDIAHQVQEHLRDTQAYLDETLSLRDLAMELSLSPHHLSQAINQVLGMNFFELVNRERVQHSQRLMESSTAPLLDIAYESGFRSKSTFNSLFKQYTGITPSQYRKTLPQTGKNNR